MSVDTLRTSPWAWFNIALRPRKPDGSLGRTAVQPGRPPWLSLTQLLNWICEPWHFLQVDATYVLGCPVDILGRASRDQCRVSMGHSILLYVHGNQRRLGVRTDRAQDGHLDSHTAPELSGPWHLGSWYPGYTDRSMPGMVWLGRNIWVSTELKFSYGPRTEMIFFRHSGLVRDWTVRLLSDDLWIMSTVLYHLAVAPPPPPLQAPHRPSPLPPLSYPHPHPPYVYTPLPATHTHTLSLRWLLPRQ